jgi:multidrug efflux pump subunit AcrB
MTVAAPGVAGKLAGLFINSRLTTLAIVSSICLGVGALLLLPREEEPQIVVPMIDVLVEMQGADAREVEQRVTRPIEHLIWEIPDVEYVYSTSSAGSALAVVRFRVGTDEARALVQLNSKLQANLDRLPPGVQPPLVKPRSIDDVPILALTLASARYDHLMLRVIAGHMIDSIKQVEGVSEVRLIGGRRRQIGITLDSARLASHGIPMESVTQGLSAGNSDLRAGSYTAGDQEYIVNSRGFFTGIESIRNLVIRASNGRPVHLKDVAQVEDGPEEPVNYVFHGNGQAVSPDAEMLPAVTISIAKRKGVNATDVAARVLDKVETLKGHVIPVDVSVNVTRNYGQTAADKSNELLYHMFLAIVTVSLLIWFALGRRESGIVALAIPVTLALTLAVFYLYGYTLNRVTLFALIFSIGILVDDAIVVVENIVRHSRLPENGGRPMHQVALEAVAEVGNPTILATAAVIAAILPMAFVRGLMGPYMRPIPVGATAAMIFSLLVAFTVTPWASVRLIGGGTGSHGSEGFTTRLYRRVMTPLIHRPQYRYGFLGAVLLLLVIAAALVPLGAVRVKMLPFDNKSEFQVIVDLPEGTTLEQTLAVERRIGEYLRTVPEVKDYQLYAGTASPYNFNGLVRHYFMRQGPNVGDIQVNLLPRDERSAQSHDIAKRVRGPIQEIARASNANVKIAEVPPGPPVLQTIVAEVYGPDYTRQIELARQIRDTLARTDGVVDVDWYAEELQPNVEFTIDSQKAALNGISAVQAATMLKLALSGQAVGLLHDSSAKEAVPIIVRLPRESRSGLEYLRSVRLAGSQGQMVPLSEISTNSLGTEDRNIYHKNLLPVVYVTGDVSGAEESPVYAILKLNRELDKIELPEGYRLERHVAAQPSATHRLAMKWDGEWHISYEVFRDLGLAFAVVLVLIYVLITGWFQSYRIPLTIMSAIPFSLVGILPAHSALGAFFTATSMIGFIAGAGIVVRNSIILVDFIELRLAQGMPLEEAVVDAGAVRFRPMMLTAAAVIVGAGVILFDPIFQGLAISLMAGEVASLLLSRMTVPILFFISESRRRSAAVQV